MRQNQEILREKYLGKQIVIVQDKVIGFLILPEKHTVKQSRQCGLGLFASNIFRLILQKNTPEFRL
jgi:hypothetical protein